MASFGQDGVVDEPPVIVDGRDGAPPAVGVIQVVVDMTLNTEKRHIR